MSHTYESVLKFFGEKAQIVAGAIIVNEGGKNVEVGYLDNATGVFTVRPAGLTLLDSEKPQAQKGKSTPKDAIPDLGLDSLK